MTGSGAMNFHIKRDTTVHAGLGEKDQALVWLDRALEDRSHWLVWLKLDPRLGTLRSDRRYGDLLLRVGLR
jgi:hypothetical protein